NGTSGTSIATAQVTGVASKILEKDKSKSPDFVKSLIIASSKEVSDGGVVTGAVDCEYALSIYDEFAENYSPGTTVEEYSNPGDVEEYNTEGLVKGLWSSAGHIQLANDAEEPYAPNANALNLVIKGAVIADASDSDSSSEGVGYNFKEIRAFHGTGNYIASMKLTWHFINIMKKTEDIEKAYSSTADLMYDMDAYYTNDESANLYEDLLATLYMLDAINFSEFKLSKYETHSTETIRFVKYKAMGLFIHIVGDTFAHRALVPNDEIYINQIVNFKFNSKNAFVTSNNSGSTKSELINEAKTNNIYNVKDRNLPCLRKTASYGVLECRDIKYYSNFFYKNNNVQNKPKETSDDYKKEICKRYEDNPNFISVRYNTALKICKNIFKNKQGKELDYSEILKKCDGVTLNNYESYLKKI
ncbi:MAG: S8/S53 family peptidase, partial [Clostridia bacterium]|nr:S8/S53 family peptidase [Clostridia bacterium]